MKLVQASPTFSEPAPRLSNHLIPVQACRTIWSQAGGYASAGELIRGDVRACPRYRFVYQQGFRTELPLCPIDS